jgi:hypothetical protein
MRFLEEAFRRTRKRLLLEKWLLLAARCLLLALLALAIGRPLLGALGGAGGKGRTFFIVIDNSIAAQATDDAGKTALSRHISAAREVLSTLRPADAGAGGDRVALITLAHPADGLVIPASPDAGAVGSLLDGLEAADSKADVAGAMSLIAAAMSPDQDGKSAVDAAAAYVVMLSDFLEGSADLGPGGGSGSVALGGAKLPRGVTMLATEPATEGVSNISIIGVEPLRAVLIGASDAESAGAGEQVRITLRRSGPGIDAAAATVVRARIGPPDADGADTAESRAVVRWTPGQESAMVAVALPPLPARGAASEAAASASAGGAAVITVSIDRDALDADNTWRRPVEIRESLRVGIVAPTRFGRPGSVDKLDAAAWVRLALAPRAEGAAIGGVEVVTIEPASMDAARLSGLDAVVLPRPDLLGEGSWARIRLFIEGGGLALVMPPPGVTVHLWGDEMIRVLEPGFAIAREARMLTSGAEGSRPVVITSGSAESGSPANSANSSAPATAGLLSLIEGELVELLRPVTVSRILPMLPIASAAGAQSSALPGQTLLALQDGTPLLWVGGVGVREEADAAAGSTNRTHAENRGVLAYMATALDLEWTDLPTKPLMVPLFNELVLQGVGRAKGATWTLAGTRPATGRRAAELVRIGSAENARAVSIDDEGFASEPIRRAGLWQARDERGARRSLLAVNPDPAGARTGAQPRDALQTWLGGTSTSDEAGAATTQAIVWLPREGAAATASGAPSTVRGALAAAIGSAEQGSPVSLPLLIAVLALGLIELVLGRWASHASVVSANMPRGASLEAAA